MPVGEVVEGTAGEFFFRPFPHAFNLTAPTHGHLVLSLVSLESRDQDGGLSNSTTDIYDLTEKIGDCEQSTFPLQL